MDTSIQNFGRKQKEKIKLKQELKRRSIREGLYLSLNSDMPVFFNHSNISSKLASLENHSIKMLRKKQ